MTIKTKTVYVAEDGTEYPTEFEALARNRQSKLYDYLLDAAKMRSWEDFDREPSARTAIWNIARTFLDKKQETIDFLRTFDDGARHVGKGHDLPLGG